MQTFQQIFAVFIKECKNEVERLSKNDEIALKKYVTQYVITDKIKHIIHMLENN